MSDDLMWSDLFEEVQHSLRLNMNCRLLLKPDQLAVELGIPGRWYYQIECDRPDSITGEMGVGRGGKAYLSPNMTRSELVQTAFRLYDAYWHHEAREGFFYEGVQVYGPHFDVLALHKIGDQTETRDG